MVVSYKLVTKHHLAVYLALYPDCIISLDTSNLGCRCTMSMISPSSGLAAYIVLTHRATLEAFAPSSLLTPPFPLGHCFRVVRNFPDR